MKALHLAFLIAVLLSAAAAPALGQSARTEGGSVSAVALDQLPKHPIPYRLLRPHPAAKPKHSVAPAPVALSSSLPPAPPGTAPALVNGAKPPTGTTAPATPAPAPPSAPNLNQPASGKAIKSATPPSPPPPPPPPLSQPQVGARLRPQDPLPAAELEAFIDGQISSAMTLNHVHGMAVSVVQNGQLVFEKGYVGPDAASGQAIDPRRTMVRLGSASQLFTWIAVLKAVEDGRLRLDDPINAHLPDSLQVPDEGFDRPILLRHLLSHSGGFEDRALGRRYVLDPDQLLALDDALRRYRPRRVRAAGLLSIPSAYGVALAGAAAGKAEGMGFDQLIETKVLAPIGLAHTSFREPYPPHEGLADPLDATLAASLAPGFRWTSHGFVPEPFSYGQSLAPSVAASSTPDDMARLMIALLNGGRFGSATLYGPATAALLFSPSQRPTEGMQGWAHGLALKRLPSGQLALFDLGSTLTFQSQAFLVPQLNLGIFISADTDTGAGAVAELPTDLVARFYGGTPMSTPSRGSAQADASGSYLSAQRTYHGLEAFADRLRLGSSLRQDPASGAVTVRTRHQSKTYAPVGGDLFRAWDGSELLLSAGRDRAQAYILGSGGGAAQRVDTVHTVEFLAGCAAAVLLASFASFTGMFTYDRSDQRETRSQTAANAVQIAACAMWCVSLVLIGFFVRYSAGSASLMFDWPNRWLVVGSWSALTASLLSLATVVQIPGVWREGRRIQGWTTWRKIRHTATVILFVAFTALLAAWGALEPWSS